MLPGQEMKTTAHRIQYQCWTLGVLPGFGNPDPAKISLATAIQEALDGGHPNSNMAQQQSKTLTF